MKSTKRCNPGCHLKQKRIFRNPLKLFFTFLGIGLILTSCTKEPDLEVDLSTRAANANVEYLDFILTSALNMDISVVDASQHSYRIITTAHDPYVYTVPLTKKNGNDNVVLTFEYTSNVDIQNVQIFFAYPVTEERSVKGLKIPASSEWSTCSFVLAKEIDTFEWGNIGDLLRLDPGDDPGVTLNIRNMHFRVFNEDEREEVENSRLEYLDFVLSSKHSMDITLKDENTHSYEIITTGDDPFVNSTKLKRPNGPKNLVLSFEYTLNRDLTNLQIFFADPLTEARSVKNIQVPAASSWTTFSYVMAEKIEEFNWGSVGDYIRFDPGDFAGTEMNIRKLHFRAYNEDEEEDIQTKYQFEQNLKKYLSSSFTSTITNVSAGANTITVTGNYSGTGSYSLCEITPYQDVTVASDLTFTTSISSPSFSFNVDRYVEREGFTYDRTLSKWAIVENGEKTSLVSHAKYAENIYNAGSAGPAVLNSKKGLGGLFYNSLQFSDYDDLGITSGTINIPITQYMYSTPGAGRIEHQYGGKSYYFDNSIDVHIGGVLQEAGSRDIKVAAIILIQPTGSDPVIAEALKHPSYTSRGIYTMPNMTNPESMNIYAAALDFLASRYDGRKGYGHIHHWIMHNEVDMGHEWTNMGNPMITTYMDTYIKSMRLCYNIARQYYAYAEVFASYTHSWTSPSDANSYVARDMIDILVKYSSVEEDFQWALAYHCYPQDLLNPSTWAEPNATFSYNTPYVTFKNLEVLDYWAKMPSHMYKGSTMRSVWLSENGTSSPSYSDRDLALQAAGFAYGWQKIKALDGISGIQWHNWYDNPVEGVQLGLRKNPANNHDAKPVWYAYQAAGTSSEEAVFAPYLSVIGIPDWNVVQNISGSFAR